MVQSLNPSAIWTLTTAVLRRPSLMIPDLQVATIADIDWQALQQQQQQQQSFAGRRALVFDKDNTLTAPYAKEIHPTCRASIQQAIQVYGIDSVAVLSNSAGTATDDPDSADALAFEQANVEILGGQTLPVIRHAAKKPSRECLHQVLEHFNNQKSDTPKLQASDLIMVGDRLWTDIVFGNLYGCTTIYTAKTLDDTTDNWMAKRIRPVEQRVTRFWQRVLRKKPAAVPSPKEE